MSLPERAETDLLSGILPRLSRRSVVVVGAGKGNLVRAMLRAGAEQVHALECRARDLELLRARFRDEERVVIHASAVENSASMRPAVGSGEFRSQPRADQEEPSAGAHTGDELTARSLRPLLVAGALAGRIGVLTIDLGRGGLDVLDAAGELDCDVILAMHWPAAREPDRAPSVPLEGALRPFAARGLVHRAVLVHCGESVSLGLDDGEIPPGARGSIVLLHERVLEAALPALLACAATLAEGACDLAERRSSMVDALIGALDRQEEVLEERDEMIDALGRERDTQAAAAAERLSALEQLEREREQQTTAATERLAVIARLSGQNPGVEDA